MVAMDPMDMKVYKSVNPEAIVMCLKCRHSAEAKEFGATVLESTDLCICHICESEELWIEQ